MPRLQINDLLEILIIAVLLYVFMVWIQSTRAYTLLRGILVVGIFTIFAWVFQLTTILWISQKIASVALIALVIIFQPELRKALDSLGQRNFIFHFFVFDNSQEIVRFSDAIINEIIRAVNEMAEVRTGALIVIEQNIRLDEFINTGIEMDSSTRSFRASFWSISSNTTHRCMTARSLCAESVLSPRPAIFPCRKMFPSARSTAPDIAPPSGSVK